MEPAEKSRTYTTDDAALELFEYDASMDGSRADFTSEVRSHGSRAIENFIHRHKKTLHSKGTLQLLRRIEKSFENPRSDIEALAHQTFNILDDYVTVERDSIEAQRGGIHAHASQVRRDAQGPDPKATQTEVSRLHKTMPSGSPIEIVKSIARMERENQLYHYKPFEEEARRIVLARLQARHYDNEAVDAPAKPPLLLHREPLRLRGGGKKHIGKGGSPSYEELDFTQTPPDSPSSAPDSRRKRRRWRCSNIRTSCACTTSARTVRARTS